MQYETLKLQETSKGKKNILYNNANIVYTLYKIVTVISIR